MEILVTRRQKGVHLSDYWEFPGGKIHEGETPEAALRREIREELDLEIDVGELCEQICHAYPDRPDEQLDLAFYLCRVRSGQPKALVAAEFRWVPVKELGRLPFPEADAELIRNLPERLAS